MTHISRPIQIALAAAVLFIAVWFVALRGHGASTSSSSSGSSSSPAASSSAPSSGSQSSAQNAPGGGTPASKGHVYHGSAPGVEGLSRAIQRAQGAVAQSQQNAQQSRQKSQEASSGAQSRNAQGQTQNSQAQGGQQTQQTQSRQQQTQQQQSQSKSSSTQATPAKGVPAMQAVVEGELAHGKTVAVLIWNPKGADDATVRRELRAAGRDAHGKLVVHVARSSEVGSFGSFARAVQVYSTPTILLIDSKGRTSSITGLTDVFAIEQSLHELHKAK